VSSTQIDATTPDHAGGAVDVVVTNPDTQSGTLTNGYMYMGPAPTVTAVAPASGPWPGGTAVTITGTNFVSGATVTFGGTAATGVNVVDATSITATTPAHAGGTVDVTVTNPDTGSGTLSSGYTYTAAGGGISFVRCGGVTGTSFSLNIGSPGTDRLVVVIADHESAGINLTGVTVDGKSAHLVTRANNIVGAGNHQEMWYADEDDLGASSGIVTVAIAGGDATWATLACLYTGVDQLGPTDFGIDETSASVTTVTVPGIDVPADGLVVMGTAEDSGGLTVNPWTSPLTLRQDGPDPGSADLMNASGLELSVQTNKTYVATFSASFNGGTGIVAVWPDAVSAPPPTVSSVAPTSGPTAGGTSVTITGTGFNSGVTDVTFGGTAAASVTFVSSTQIDATTPLHVAEVVDVVVTNPDTQTGTLTDGYIYTDSPCDTNVCWDGGGTTNNWSEGANWAEDVVPGPGDTAVFGDLSPKNAIIDIPVTIQGLIIDTLYTGTVTQSSGMTVTIGSTGYDQSAGTFVGADTAIAINGAFTLSGGNMTSTSGTMSVQNDFTISGGTFTHNSGSINFDGDAKTVDIGATALNTVTINQGASDFTVTGTMDMNGDLTITGASAINGGTIAVEGDVTSTDTSVAGTGTILLDRNGGQQILSGGGELPSVTINKSEGLLKIEDTIKISGNWTHTAGPVNAGTSTVIFTTGAQTVSSGSMSFNNVSVSNGGSALTVAGNMPVNGSLTLNGAINGGPIAVAGNVTSGASVAGTGTILLDGIGAQTLSGGDLPNVTINKSSGTLTIQDIQVSGNWTYSAGTVAVGTSTVVFTTGGQTVNAGSMSFYHVTFDTGGSSITISGTMDVNGTLTITDVASIDTGTIAVAGNVTSTDAIVSGTASITLDGTADQTINVLDIPNGTFTINKASGTATLISHLILNSSQALNITVGTLDQGSGKDLTAGSITLAAGTTWKNLSGAASTITIGGSVSNDGTIDFNSSTAGCGEADAIRIRSTTGGVTRAWSGTGAFALIDVDVKDQVGTTAIIVFNGTDTGNNGSNWTFNDCDSAPTVIIIDWREVY
jgi:hypothetical protein